MPAAPRHGPESEFETIYVDYATGEFPATNNRALRTRAASALLGTQAPVLSRESGNTIIEIRCPGLAPGRGGYRSFTGYILR